MEKVFVKNMKHFRELLNAGRHEYFIVLAGGLVRSSKDIELIENGKFCVVNYIDDTTQHLTEKELYTKSNIGEALDKHSLVCE